MKLRKYTNGSNWYVQDLDSGKVHFRSKKEQDAIDYINEQQKNNHHDIHNT